MREIRYEAHLPVAQAHAFDFVSTPGNWGLFLDGVDVVDVADDWGRPGGQARLVIRLFGRPVTSHLELTHWDPPRAFRYTARQRGRPPVDNHRSFEATGAGTLLVGTTRVAPRAGLRFAADLLALRVLHRTYRRGMTRLPTVIGRP
jgi:hypothetical protein